MTSTPTVNKVEALFITVNYKNEDVTATFLSSLAQLENIDDCYVIVCDVASTDSSTEKLHDIYRRSGIPAGEILCIRENVGYFPAARLAFDHFCRSQDTPKFVVICNNDLTIETKDFVDKLRRRGDLDDLGCIAPDIRLQHSMKPQNPFLLTRASRSTFLFWYMAFATRRLASFVVWALKVSKGVRRFVSRGPSWAADVARTIYAPYGALLVLTSTYFERGGCIEDRVFLYAEEISIAEACRAARLRIVYDPSIRVLHQGQASTGRKMSKVKYDSTRRAIQFILNEYYRR